MRLTSRVLLVSLIVLGGGRAAINIASAQTTQEKPGTGAPAPNTPAPGANAGGNGQNCGEPDKPLPAEQIAGTWESPKDAPPLVVTQTDPKSTAKFTAKGEFAWDGSYGGGKLTFTRKPTAEEMSGAGPLWARQIIAASGKLQWTMELEPKIKCGVPTLEGKWYPGAFEYDEELDAAGNVVKQSADVSDPKGAPIDVVYVMHVPSHIYLYARTLTGLQYIEELYLGVSTIVELHFSKPNPKEKFDVDLSVGSQKLTLTAGRLDDKGYIFRTNAFVPGAATISKDDSFNPAPPPAPTQTGRQ